MSNLSTRSDRSADRQLPSTSIIVSTYNASRYMRLCLTALAQQTETDFELIVADDGSSDNHIKNYRQALEDLGLSARLLWQPDEGFRKSKILNASIKAATSAYVIFLDGDCVVAPDFVAQHRKKARPGRFLTGTRIRLGAAATEKLLDEAEEFSASRQIWEHGVSVLPNTHLWLKRRSREFGIASIASLLDPTKRTFNGCNSSCWRADAVAVGGLDERFTYGGEDVEFGERLVNHGISAQSVRYHARGLHLHHRRPYFDEQAYAQNMSMLENTRRSQQKRTEFGIGSPRGDNKL